MYLLRSILVHNVLYCIFDAKERVICIRRSCTDSKGKIDLWHRRLIYNQIEKKGQRKGVMSWLACATDEIKLWLSPSAKQRQNPCSGSPPVYHNLSTCHDWVLLGVVAQSLKSVRRNSRPIILGFIASVCTYLYVFVSLVRSKYDRVILNILTGQKERDE